MTSHHTFTKSTPQSPTNSYSPKSFIFGSPIQQKLPNETIFNFENNAVLQRSILENKLQLERALSQKYKTLLQENFNCQLHLAELALKTIDIVEKFQQRISQNQPQGSPRSQAQATPRGKMALKWPSSPMSQPHPQKIFQSETVQYDKTLNATKTNIMKFVETLEKQFQNFENMSAVNPGTTSQCATPTSVAHAKNIAEGLHSRKNSCNSPFSSSFRGADSVSTENPMNLRNDARNQYKIQKQEQTKKSLILDNLEARSRSPNSRSPSFSKCVQPHSCKSKASTDDSSGESSERPHRVATKSGKTPYLSSYDERKLTNTSQKKSFVEILKIDLSKVENQYKVQEGQIQAKPKPSSNIRRSGQNGVKSHPNILTKSREVSADCNKGSSSRNHSPSLRYVKDVEKTKEIPKLFDTFGE